jgi:hypothetical protein
MRIEILRLSLWKMGRSGKIGFAKLSAAVEAQSAVMHRPMRNEVVQAAIISKYPVKEKHRS